MATHSQGYPWGCLTVISLAGLATWFSNPSLATHRRVLRGELQQRVDRELTRQDFWSLLWLTKDTTIETIVDCVSYQNYGLASLTKYENQQLTFGVGCQVFFVAEDHSAPAVKHP